MDAVRWEGGRLLAIDQRLIPEREEWLELHTWQDVAEAIRSMAIRGAPLIGIAAAYGLALADNVEEAKAGLAATRPTAVNLFHALERVARADDRLAAARKIEAEEKAANEAIGRHGASLISEGASVLTVCNTGSLATAGIGTALGIIRTAHLQGKIAEVFACETRPRLQGLRLTAWELHRDRIPFKVLPDGAAAWLMKEGKVDLVIAGADRIAANGDTANKIGTYALALAANHHGIPFVVAAPASTIDPKTPSGADIPIEERAASEVTTLGQMCIGPADCSVWNPAFDVTPAALITRIVTERGALAPPYDFGGVFSMSQE